MPQVPTTPAPLSNFSPEAITARKLAIDKPQRMRIPPGMGRQITVDGESLEADADGFVMVPLRFVGVMRDSHGLLET